MTTKKAKPNFKKYAYSALGAQFVQSGEDLANVFGASDSLAGDLDFGVDGTDLYKGMVTSEEAVKQFISIYLQKFQENLKASNMSDVYKWYSTSTFGDASTAQKKLFKSEYDKHTGTYGDFTEKVNMAEYDSNHPTDKAKQKSGKEELAKYQNFMKLDSALQKHTLETLRPEAMKASRKRSFEGLEKMFT